MNSSDQSFFDEYKPLHVPHEYDASAGVQNNVIYALAQLKEATANEVAIKLGVLEPATPPFTHQKNAEDVLKYLFNKGGELSYNLSKIETPNSGKADKLY
jgi:hypothetical protein